MQGFLARSLITPYGFAVFFAILWSAVSFLIASLSGWRALAKRFQAQTDPYGEMKSAGPFFYTVYVRFWGHYSSCIRMVATSDALFLSVFFLFRIGHPPLRIPWSEIQFSNTTFFLRPYVVVTLGSEEQIPIRIPLRMARNLGILDRVPN